MARDITENMANSCGERSSGSVYGRTKGASIYVTLEPCCHYGKTASHANAILEAGIRRVIIGSSDPNPLVAEKGIRFERSGIEITENILKEECDKLNEAFFFLHPK